MKRPLLGRYILVDGQPVIVDELMDWARFYDDTEGRIVRQDFLLYVNRVLIISDQKTYDAACEHKEMFQTPLSAEQIEHNIKARKKKAELGGVPIKISTIFLGIDHNFYDDGPPILWETMLFGIDHKDFGQHRYNSQKKALKGHQMLLDTLMNFARLGKLEHLLQDAGKSDGEENETKEAHGRADRTPRRR